jgi:hypothetical protein
MALNRNVLLLLCAIAAAIVFTLMGFNVWTYEHPFGVLGLAVALGLASRLP